MRCLVAFALSTLVLMTGLAGITTITRPDNVLQPGAGCCRH
jgi:hypothetical protein